MTHPVTTLARYVLIEARRGGLPWLAGAALVLALGIAAFLSQLALTEGAALQAAFAAALLRAAAVFLIAAHVAASTLREAADKTLDLVLALPVSRTAYYLGKLAGYAACGAVLAAVCALPLLLWSPPGAVLLWTGSLAAEALLVAAAALFFATTLKQIVPALAATAGLYLLARSMAAIQAIAGGPFAADSYADRLARHAVDLIALLLPRLDAATRTEWLLYGAPATHEWAAALGSLTLYAALLAAAGLFDLHRRNL